MERRTLVKNKLWITALSACLLWGTASFCSAATFTVSLNSVTPSGCVTAGESITVNITTSHTGGANVEYAYAFTNGGGLGGGSVAWVGTAGNTACSAGGGFQVSNPFVETSSQTLNNTITVPSTAFTITTLYVVAILANTQPYCNGSSSGTVTDNTSLTICTPTPNGSTPTKTPTGTVTPTPQHSYTPTSTPTKTPTGTITPTPTSGGAAPTNTFTPGPTNTFTITSTPTVTYTPTVTNSPTITNSPTPLPCNWPVGATPAVNIFGGPAGGNPVYCYASGVTTLTDKVVFGMSLADVKNIADYVGNNNTASPVTLNIASNWKLSYFDGNLTYGPANPAPYDQLGKVKTGMFGVLVVNGNLTLQPPSGSILPSHFGGIVFVTGNLTVGDGCEIDGSVIMGKPYYNGTPGTVTLTGSAGNFGTINFSPSLVTTAQSLVGTYKEDVSQRNVLLAIPGL